MGCICWLPTPACSAAAGTDSTQNWKGQRSEPLTAAHDLLQVAVMMDAAQTKVNGPQVILCD